MKVTVVPVVFGAPKTVNKSLEKTGGTGNQMKNLHETDENIVKIG